MRSIPVLVISGFLGTGKTTFIQQLLHRLNPKYKVVVIENDFGQLSFDSHLLAQNGTQVKELRQGCICCSLQGDFATALDTILTEEKVDLIIIEPSGVSKTSDILGVCQNDNLKKRIHVQAIVTMLDKSKTLLYAQNFGNFFNDQLSAASMFILTCLDDAACHPEPELIKLIQEHSPHAPIILPEKREYIIDSLLSSLNAPETKSLVSPAEDQVYSPLLSAQSKQQHPSAECLSDHDCSHLHSHSHVHSHHAEHPFQTHTLSVTMPQTEVWYQQLLETLRLPSYQVVRVKGIMPVRTDTGEISYKMLQIAGDINGISPVNQKGNYLTIITKTNSKLTPIDFKNWNLIPYKEA